MKLQLNLKVKDNSTKVEEVERKVVKARKEVLSFDDAWKEIVSKKNSASDLVKLREVYKAMKEGRIGREEGKENKTLTKAEALRQWKVLQEQERGAKLEAMVKNTPDNFILVQNIIQLDEVIKVVGSEPIIAVDTETTGVDVYKDKMVGLSFTAPKQDKHYYIPIRHITGETQLPVDTVVNAIRKILENSNIEKVFHNAIFDLHIFRGEGLEVEGKVHDTLVIAHLMNENEPSFRLKDLAPKYLKCEADTFDALFGKNCLFSTVVLPIANYYACKDTKLTWELFAFYMKYLNTNPFLRLKNNYDTIEQPLIKAVFEMERVGFVIDMDEVEKQKVELTARKEQLEELLKVHFGDINFNSPTQLSKVLYDHKKLHLLKEIPPNFKKSTDSKTLKILAKYDEGCAVLREYKDVTKHLSSFVEKLPTMVHEDGKLRGSFKQTGTVTGRFSSVNPNLQQQPHEARKMFTAPEGKLILGADFSAQEPRLLAHFTQDPTLLKIYEEGKDLYSTYASLHYKRPYEEVYKNPDGSDTKERKQFKMVILAIMYGMTEKSLAETLGINELEAKTLIDGFYKGSPQVAKWIEFNKQTARMEGYVETLFGRKRRLPDAKSSDKWARMRAERQTTNARIQGSASEQTKLVMIKAYEKFKELRKQGREFDLLATIHDEVLFLVPEDITREEVKMIESLMVDTVKLNNVPSKTDIELGKCWGDLTSVADWQFKN
jgi:DNA polymerase-1